MPIYRVEYIVAIRDGLAPEDVAGELLDHCPTAERVDARRLPGGRALAGVVYFDAPDDRAARKVVRRIRLPWRTEVPRLSVGRGRSYRRVVIPLRG